MNRNFLEAIETDTARVKDLSEKDDIKGIIGMFNAFCSKQNIDLSDDPPQGYFAVWCFLSQVSANTFTKACFHMNYNMLRRSNS